MADDAAAQVPRGKTPAGRVGVLLAANRTMRLVTDGGLRTRDPDRDDARVSAEAAGWMLPGSD